MRVICDTVYVANHDGRFDGELEREINRLIGEVEAGCPASRVVGVQAAVVRTIDTTDEVTIILSTTSGPGEHGR